MSKEKQSYEELIAELKEIRKLLTPPPEPESEPEEKPKGLKRFKKFGFDFVDFLKKYKIIGLAVAFIMAVYVGALVNSVVNDIIFGLLGDIPGLKEVLVADSTVSWMDWPFASEVRLGAFFSNIITFVIVAFVVFLIVKLSKKIGLD
ncbi:MAG: MscL family protein [Promethearchaeota archaeon]